MSRTVLVADDDPAARAVVVKCLENAGYTTMVATDGLQALQAAETGKPDLILLDLLLPRKDGYAVLLDLRSRLATMNVPVVIVSAEDGDRQTPVARVLGAQGYIAKPIRPEVLLTHVEAAFRAREAS